MRARSAWRRGSLAAGFAALLLLSGMARADAALDWLNRAAAAAKQQNYSGVYVYHHGEHVEVLRVLHRTDATGELEKVEVLDGTPRKLLDVSRLKSLGWQAKTPLPVGLENAYSWFKGSALRRAVASG